MKLIRPFILALSCSAFFFISFSLQGQTEPIVMDVELELAATVEAKPISEMSGIVKSRSRDDLYWIHNDSGDEARIFAINKQGENVIPTYSKFSFYGEKKEQGKKQWQGFTVLFSENVDWEDMTIDDNYIYISDMGNNANDREDLGIYIISEIDPTASTQSASIKYLPVRYPEQQSFPASVWNFDSESLFSADGSLYLITKHRVTGSNFEWTAGASLYRLDTDFSDQDNLLTLVERHSEITAATSAEVSPNGQVLAVLSLSALWLFDKPAAGDAWLSSTSRKIEFDTAIARQVEAVAWIDDETVLITNEQRDIFHLNLAL